MIGSLQGKPKIIDSETLLVDVTGVGYEVKVPRRVMEKVNNKRKINLWIHTHLRKDILTLFGFRKKEELHLFRTLLSISGIGPKLAIAILNREVFAIKKAVATADVEFFTAIPKLGKKNAQRIIIELKPKLGSLTDLDLAADLEGETADVIEALESMGFSSKEAREAINQIPKEVTKVEDKIKYILKLLGRK